MDHPSSPRLRPANRLAGEIWRQLNGPGWVLLCLALVAGMALWGGVDGLGLPPAAERAIGEASSSALWPGWPVRLVLALVAAGSALRLLHGWIPSWAAPPAGRLSRLDALLPTALEAAADDATGGTVGRPARLERALATVGLRIARCEGRGDARSAVAADHGPARWLRGALNAGVLLTAAVALLISGVHHYGAHLPLTLGETRALPGEDGVVASLDQIRLGPRAGDEPAFTAQVTLRDPSWPADRVLELAPGRPAQVDELTLRLVAYGPAARVSARGADGARYDIMPVGYAGEASPLARVSFRSSQEQLLAIPEAGLVVHVIYYPPENASQEQGGTLDVEVWRSSDGVLLGRARTSSAAAIQAGPADVQITPEYDVVVQAAREPLVPLAMAGLALMLLGLAAHLFWPERRVWLSWRAGASPAAELWVARAQAQTPWVACLLALLKEEADESST